MTSWERNAHMMIAYKNQYSVLVKLTAVYTTFMVLLNSNSEENWAFFLTNLPFLTKPLHNVLI